MKHSSRLFCVAFLLFSSVGFLKAEVRDAAANGFNIEIALPIQAAPDAVFHAIVDSIGRWWESSHTFSGKSENLYLEPAVGGCFCERLPSGGGVQHLEVVFVDPGKRLNLQGGLGPLQTMAVSGALSIVLRPDGTGTNLQLTYRVGGYLKDGLETLAPIVNGVLQEQVERLKRFVEQGAPEAGS